MALAACFAYQSRRKLGWLILSGLLFSLSLLIKPIAAPFYLPLGALVLLESDQGGPALNQRTRLWAAFTGIVATPFCLRWYCSVRVLS